MRTLKTTSRRRTQQWGNEEENLDPDAGKSQQQVIDEITGQLNLFDNE